MLGIKGIATYLPEQRASNLELMGKFDVDAAFLSEKIGVLRRSVRADGEETSEMALKALERLIDRLGLVREEIQVLVVVTQNPDSSLPHVSGLIHARAGLSPQCAAFDLSLGCSGYVYGLSVMQSFMAANGMVSGVLITCDPYSKIIDPDDKGTVLLFGDAATATLIAREPQFICSPFVFGTKGDVTGALANRGGKLQMNGREVFNFAATVVPPSVNDVLVKAGLTPDDIDCYLFHQGSKYIVDTLARRLSLPPAKVRRNIEELGNTVSSSIPILLQAELDNRDVNRILLCGFGVGLSWASCICNRVEKSK